MQFSHCILKDTMQHVKLLFVEYRWNIRPTFADISRKGSNFPLFQQIYKSSNRDHIGTRTNIEYWIIHKCALILFFFFFFFLNSCEKYSEKVKFNAENMERRWQNIIERNESFNFENSNWQIVRKHFFLF